MTSYTEKSLRAIYEQLKRIADNLEESNHPLIAIKGTIGSTESHPNIEAAAEMLWGVVANVSGGNWEEQSKEWQEAAAKWRDYYMSISTPDDKLQRVKNRLAEKVTNENVDEIARSIVDIFEGEYKLMPDKKPEEV